VTFRRARSDEQREERRRTILEVLAGMLGEMPVSEVSLNELSRRVGLAKSNVLRYVESREAALLDLMHARLGEWLAAVDAAPPAKGSLRERTDAVARLLAEGLAARPVLCDLLGAQFGVLERNVSAELAGRHKHRFLDATAQLSARLRVDVPELTGPDATKVASALMLVVGTVWNASRPTEAMVAAYAADPALAVLRIDVTDTLAELIAVLIAGLVVRA
jgi:AcrR family transcriptional regulator